MLEILFENPKTFLVYLVHNRTLLAFLEFLVKVLIFKHIVQINLSVRLLLRRNYYV